ncbi:alpha/beta hydrolase [Christensenellaceae bacterium OttesenSCG-928-L17]|nr:alpha/beta hydrolase [Christensenellaceae bacterium OttesenSCG-928-L17]
MPTAISHILQAAVRGFRPLLNNLSLEMERMGQDVLARADVRLPENMVVATDCIGDMRAEWFHTLGAPEDEVLIYFHGGAYMAGSIESNRILAVDFAQATKRNVLSFEYRLAPEHPFPAALEDAIAAYRYVLDLGVKPERIAFVGESAGGGLEIVTALKARELGLPLPAVIVAISPWTDLTLRGKSYTENERVDPLLLRKKLVRAVMYYAYGQDLQNSYISPLYADFSGFPPTLIHVGTHELLLSDAQGLHEAMLRDGVEVKLEEWKGMWHVWHVFDIPESRTAFMEIADYISERISPGEPAQLEKEQADT